MVIPFLSKKSHPLLRAADDGIVDDRLGMKIMQGVRLRLSKSEILRLQEYPPVRLDDG
jgi:hypothetical protein